MGGLERKPQDFFREQILIAEADMSTAWACGIIGVHAFQIALMSQAAQEEVYAEDPNTLVSSSYNPVGAKAEMAEGGFMLSGRWGWSSGSDHCSWALLGGVIPGDGYRTFLIPRSQYDIEDTWNVMGLQGTGSNDVVIEKPIFVPEHRTHRQMDGFNCVNEQDNAIYDLSWAQTFVRVVNTAAIGALKKALKIFIDTRTQAATSDPTKLAGDVETQERIARVLNTIRELEAVMFHNFDQMEAADWSPSLEERVLYRYQASIVIDKASEAMDTLFKSPGGARYSMVTRYRICGMTFTSPVATWPTTRPHSPGIWAQFNWGWIIRTSLSDDRESGCVTISRIRRGTATPLHAA